MSKVAQDLRLIENQALSPFYHRLVFQASGTLPPCKPGQFAELLVPPTGQVFLRRPFSIHDVDEQHSTISFLIKAVGTGTRKLCQISPGTVINTIYPLGKGFTLHHDKKVLLVGGGCGIAPLLFLSRKLHEQGNKVTTLLGGRERNDIIEVSDFQKYGNTLITTEDGSLGEPGYVTDHPGFRQIGDYDWTGTCGPEAMLRAVALHALNSGVPCEVSLENTMACGIGVCLCCVVDTAEGKRCVCTEGPVFNIHQLTGWDQPKETADSCPVI